MALFGNRKDFEGYAPTVRTLTEAEKVAEREAKIKMLARHFGGEEAARAYLDARDAQEGR